MAAIWYHIPDASAFRWGLGISDSLELYKHSVPDFLYELSSYCVKITQHKQPKDRAALVAEKAMWLEWGTLQSQKPESAASHVALTLSWNPRSEYNFC